MASNKQQTPIERAKARVKACDEQWRAQYEDYINTPNFRHLSAEELIAMAESTERLSKVELAELDGAWFMMFGEWLSVPADRSRAPEPLATPSPQPEPEREDDDVLSRAEVARKLNASVSSVQRFPAPASMRATPTQAAST
jgi:hypothetical protein